MRCDASWRGGESCFSPVCCSLQLEEEEMCPPLPLLICCLFCFLLCRPQSVLARFRFLCSQLSAQREKGKNKRVGGVGRMVAGRKPSRLPWPGWRSMGTGARGRVCPEDQGGFGGLFLLGVLGITLATSARMHHSSAVPLCWPCLVGGEGWKNKVYSSSCKMWAEALGEKPRGS